MFTPLGKIKKQKYLKPMGFDPKANDPLLKAPDEALPKLAFHDTDADQYVGIAAAIPGGGIGVILGNNRGEHVAYNKANQLLQAKGIIPITPGNERLMTSEKYIKKLLKEWEAAGGNATQFLEMFKRKGRNRGAILGAGIGAIGGYYGVKALTNHNENPQIQPIEATSSVYM